jgi:DMSO/TMAO reductase YedYZ heme-binding membrane subunit
VRAAPAFVDAALVRAVVLINGAVPLAILAWDAARGQLGVNAVNFAIRTTGMLGLIFLTLTLAVTPLRELTGWSTLIAARRRMGVYACAYITLHFVIFYAFDRGGSLASTLHEIVTRRYLQLGTIALVLMLPLAITSTDAMVSRLGARRWKALHRAAYLLYTYRFPLEDQGVLVIGPNRVFLRYIERVIGHRFDDIAPIATIRRLRCPVLLVHGGEDATVPVAEAHAIHAAGGPNVQLKIVAGSHDDYADLERELPALVEFLRAALR